MVSGIVITVITCVVWGVLITLIITDTVEFSRTFRVFAGLVLVLIFGLNSVFRVLANDTVAQQRAEIVAIRADCQKAIDEGIRRMRYEDGGISPDGIREDYQREFPLCWAAEQ